MQRRLSGLVLSLALLGACTTTAAPGGMITVGASVPSLKGTDQNGAAHDLAAAKGSPVVVYFYPKDDTPGCTKEACAFRDVWAKYQEKGVRLYGVSIDDAKSHGDFAKKHSLPFPLIADENKAWVTAFGVPTMNGGMAKRVTFLVGRDGKVAKVYESVDPGVHADQVLADALALS